jgi:hypothetical protein
MITRASRISTASEAGSSALGLGELIGIPLAIVVYAAWNDNGSKEPEPIISEFGSETERLALRTEEEEMREVLERPGEK